MKKTIPETVAIQEWLAEIDKDNSVKAERSLVQKSFYWALDTRWPNDLAAYLDENPEIKLDRVEIEVAEEDRDGLIDEIFKRDGIYIPDLVYCRQDVLESYEQGRSLELPRLFVTPGHPLYKEILSILSWIADKNPFVKMVSDSREFWLDMDTGEVDKVVKQQNPKWIYRRFIWEDDEEDDENGYNNHFDNITYWERENWGTWIVEDMQAVNTAIKGLVKKWFKNWMKIKLIWSTHGDIKRYLEFDGSKLTFHAPRTPSNEFIRKLAYKVPMSCITNFTRSTRKWNDLD